VAELTTHIDEMLALCSDEVHGLHELLGHLGVALLEPDDVERKVRYGVGQAISRLLRHARERLSAATHSVQVAACDEIRRVEGRGLG